ncbi:MAG TPA: hypothetical protein VKX31_08410, partial [Brumimicrobium sp.]|nr:hypothetical protein [Brumimicrobium sp.]
MAMVTCLTTTCFGQTIDLQQKQADSLYEEGQHIKAAKLYTGLYYNSTNLNDQNARNAFRAAKAYYTIGE